MPVVRGGDRIKLHLAKARNKSGRARSVTVGYIDPTAMYPDGTRVAMIAALMEFGRRGRPFFQRGWKRAQPKARAFLRKRLSPFSGLPSKSDARKLGEMVKESVQHEIRSKRNPPNAPATLERRRAMGRLGRYPLYDSGELHDSIDVEVE